MLYIDPHDIITTAVHVRAIHSRIILVSKALTKAWLRYVCVICCYCFLERSEERKFKVAVWLLLSGSAN